MRLRVWSAEIAPLPTNVFQLRAGIAFSPSGELLAYSDGDGLHLRRAADGAPLESPDGFADGAGLFQSIAFSPDGAMLAAGRLSGGARVWCGR